MTSVAFISATSGFTDEERALRQRIYARYFPASVEVVVEGIAAGPEFLDRAQHFGEAIDAAGAYFAAIGKDRFDVVVSAGAIDPGLAAVRAICRVPVVGPGEASLYHAAIGGRRLSIVTVDEHAVASARGFVERTRCKPPIVSIRSIDVPVRQIVQDRPRAITALEREVGKAVSEDGAEAVYLGAMTLGTLEVADELRRRFGIPFFDPVAIAARTAAALAECVV